ncbi:hypothetical protein KAH55_02545 [bacterium]|nr:hypothetical protein [bacterium]
MKPIVTTLNIALVLFFVLVAATVLERFIEFMLSILAFCEPRLSRFYWWIARRLKSWLNRKLALKKDDARSIQFVVNVVKSVLLKKRVAAGEPIFIQVDFIRTLVIRVLTQAIAILLGITVAFGTHMNVIELVNSLALTNIHLPSWLGMLLTGILIGSGTSPVHSLIKGVEHRKDEKKREAQTAYLKSRMKSR